MNESEAVVGNKTFGKCLLDNWVEERSTALLDNVEPRAQIQRSGHKGILTLDMSAQVQGISTVRAAFTQPQRTGVRQKGLRSELLEKYLLQKISEQVTAEFNPEPPTTEFCSTMKADYTVEGFQSVTPPSSTERTYATEQAITFWSDNWQRVQGVTAVQTLDSPFKRNATFSTPIGLQMGEDTPYVPDHDDHL